MAAVVFIPQWIAIVMEFQTASELWHMTCNYKQNDAGPRYSGVQLQALASAWYTAMKPYLQPCQSNNVTYKKVTARDMTDADGQEGIFVVGAGEGGTVAADSEPLSVCGVNSLRTANVSRSGRGRTYLSGIPDTAVLNQVLNSTLTTALGLIGGTYRLFNGTFDVPVTAVVASRTHLLLRPVQSTSATNQVNVQFRRLPGHRRHRRRPTTAP